MTVTAPPAPTAIPAAPGPAAAPTATPTATAERSTASRLVMRASLVSMVLVALGSVLGLVRDLLVAGLNGATAETDAFLLGWMVSETAQPLLVEGAMALVMVPAFCRALASDRPQQAVRDLISGTLPVISLALMVVSGAVVLAAPLLVDVLAPGLADPALAVRCMRLAAIGLVFIGVAGYLSAGLRGHGVFGPPAALSAAGNVGMIVTMLALHERIGVTGAAVGIAVGNLAMVLVLLPSAARRLPRPTLVLRRSPVTLAAFAPVGAYMLLRHGQIYVERFIGSWLPAGSMSHLNYAQKIGQIPATLALLVATVTLPMLARRMADGRTAAARERQVADLRLILGLVLAATVFLVVFAPQVVEVLFGRGAFTAADVTATAAILRVYVLGLAGQAVVEIVCREFFSRTRPSWYPAAAMAVGLVATALAGAVLSPLWGAPGIAVANAVGITVTGALLLRRSGLAARPAVLVRAAGHVLAPVSTAAVAGVLTGAVLAGSAPLVVGLAGALVVLGTFVLTAVAQDRWVPGGGLVRLPNGRSES